MGRHDPITTIVGPLLLALLVCTGCGCATRTARVSEPTLTCAQATDAARAAVLRLGYTVTRMDPAQPGQPGTVVGQRESAVSAGTLLQYGYKAVRGQEPPMGASGGIVVESEPNAGERSAEAEAYYMITVTVTCTDAGADFAAVSDEVGFTQLDFPNRFTAALRYWLDTKPVAPRLHDKEEEGLVVTVEPQRGREATSAFGADLPALGISPVKIRLDNRTPRRYAFRTADVALVTVEGTRQPPLSPEEVAARLGSRASAAPAAERIRALALQDAELGPGMSHSGYLFLPAAAYQRVRLTVLDVETQEEEGVSAEF